MNIQRLHEIIGLTTRQFRKGEEVELRDGAAVQSVDVYCMPHTDEADQKYELVDVEFITVGVDREAAEKHKDELYNILSTYPDPERLAGGPSYIEFGAEIGDQGAALCLFALGKFLGFWDVITPKTFGVEGEEAHKMAGLGFIMISGFRKEEAAA